MTEKRIRIFKLIEALPDSALDELVETLGELQELYSMIETVETEKIIAPKSYEVTYHKPVMRPEFPIPEDYDNE